MKMGLKMLGWMMGLVALAAQAEDVEVEFKEAVLWNTIGVSYGPTAGVKNSDEDSPAPQSSLLFKYDLRGEEGQDAYCSYEYKEQVLLDQMPKSIELWVKGDKRQHPLRIQFVDRNNTVHQWNLGVISWEGWQKVAIPLKFAVVGYDQWGPAIPETGAATKSGFLDVEPPVRFHALVIGSLATGEKDAGAVKMSGLKLRK